MSVKSVLLCALAHALVAREDRGPEAPERLPLLSALLGDAAAFQVRPAFPAPRATARGPAVPAVQVREAAVAWPSIAQAPDVAAPPVPAAEVDAALDSVIELVERSPAARFAEQERSGPAQDFTPLVCTAMAEDAHHQRLQQQLAEMAIADVQRMRNARRSNDPQMFEIDFVKPVEMGIELFAGGLRSIGVKESYGPAILTFTLGLKALTFPLNKQQIESTTKMQAIAPAAKKLQERYRNKDPARLNLELQKLYEQNEVNPLAGCLPALAQIPIFICFYRALLRLAEDDLLRESFLWIPSLEGPVRTPQEGIGWLTNWVDGAPQLGWHDTAAYLVLPVVLTLSQYASTALITPKVEDPSQQQSQAILKFLPLLIGWFSLNVPQGLGLYWLANNIATTSTTLLIRRSVGEVQLAGAAADVAVKEAPVESKGFGRKYGEVVQRSVDPATGTKVTVTPPGAAATVVDAQVVEDGSALDATVVATEPGQPEERKLRKKKSGKKKKKRQ